MGSSDMLKLLLSNPNDFRILLQFRLYHEKKRDITSITEHPTSGWDRESMRRCWSFLDATSRSFSAVIKELEGDLARVICLFYLVLRGLDTVEDDMTIPDDIKQPILRSFHEKTVTPGWNFDGCGPNEKDRQLLVEYEVVVEELNRLEPAYRDAIVDICQKMENGMADFAHKAATTGEVYLEKIEDWDLYCHYVAGLVGEGISRLVAASGKEVPWLGNQLELANSMGLFLQKTNIIRDFREDVDDKRHFWPREIWGRAEYGVNGHPEFKELTELYQAGNEKQALWALSGMVVDVLRHAPDCLDYLRLLRNQSVFNFCAIPQAMAIATLTLVFMNPDVFHRNVKIRKAEAARLIMRSTNPRDVAYIFRDYTRKIHAKCSPADPNFLRISVACGQIEQWCEHYYPSFISVGASSGNQQLDTTDRRSIVFQNDQKRDEDLLQLKRVKDAQERGVVAPRKPADQNEGIPFMVFASMAFVLFLTVAVSAGIAYVIITYFSE